MPCIRSSDTSGPNFSKVFCITCFSACVVRILALWPVTFVVTQGFLDHFGLENARDLPGLKELRAAGLLENRPRPETVVETDEDEDDDQVDLFEDD